MADRPVGGGRKGRRSLVLLALLALLALLLAAPARRRGVPLLALGGVWQGARPRMTANRRVTPALAVEAVVMTEAGGLALPPPWLAGPARFDVGLRPIEAAGWLFPDDQADSLPAKAQLLRARKHDLLRRLPGSLAAEAELLAMVRAAAGAADVPVPASGSGDALLDAALAVSDDLVLLAPVDAASAAGGGWQVRSICLCAPTFFDSAHALGGDLAMLHGPVPGGAPGLAGRIGRVFDLLRPGQVLERHNWTVQWGGERHVPSAAPWRAAAAAAPTDQAAAMLVERVERQTIRKLPGTGWIVFTIRIRLTPLARRLACPEAALAFAAAWTGSAPEVRTYKGWDLLDRHVRQLLPAGFTS